MTAGNLLFYLVAFIAALGLLILVHELGHFIVARWCGVKVVRFSLGFGKPLLVRRFGPDQTEWVVAALPLGGYVKMLDENEAPVASVELPRAFNRQPVFKRILIVVAGPLANLLLAVLLYWALFLHGVLELRPVLGEPPAGTIAAQAGVENGDLVTAINGKPIETWQDLRWEFLDLALQRQAVALELQRRNRDRATLNLDLRSADLKNLDADFLQQLGLSLYRPGVRPLVGSVVAGSPADVAGIRPNDEIVAIDGRSVKLSNAVTAAVRGSGGRPLAMEVRRDERSQVIHVTPSETDDDGKRSLRIGIAFKDDPSAHVDMTTMVRYGPYAAMTKAMSQTWDTSVMSLRMIGRMITGDVSWRNLSGPVTIADYAGQSARLGIGPYLNFLALISISLGVLNLLPIPVLDGGHLLYYLAEIIGGGPLPERVAEMGRRIGLALLVMLMIFAFYNDINRLIPG